MLSGTSEMGSADPYSEEHPAAASRCGVRVFDREISANQFGLVSISDPAKYSGHFIYNNDYTIFFNGLVVVDLIIKGKTVLKARTAASDCDAEHHA